MRDLNELLKGKSVAIVGSSPHLQGSRLGARIDEHDIVIRINDASPSLSVEDLGSRTSIIALNLGSAHLDEYRHLLESEIKNNSELKAIFCPGQSWDTEPRWKRERGSISQNFQRLGVNLPLITVEDDILELLESNIGSQPTTGVATIALVLESEAKSVFLCGFSFYSTAEAYSPEKANRTKTRASIFRPPTGHKPWNEAQYLRSLPHRPRVEYDRMYASLVIEGWLRKPGLEKRIIWLVAGAASGILKRIGHLLHNRRGKNSG